jgi:hypothetical protein
MLSATVHGQSPTRDRRLIAYAKRLPASKLDPQLPRLSLGLSRLLVAARGSIGKSMIVVNIPETPNDGSGSNPPLCAQAHADLGDGRNVYVLMLVWTHKAGIKGRPTVWSVSIDDHGKEITTKLMITNHMSEVRAMHSLKSESGKIRGERCRNRSHNQLRP